MPQDFTAPATPKTTEGKATPEPTKKPEPRKMRYRLAEGDRLELNGLPIGVITNEKLQDPNVILAIQNHERRTGRVFIGTQILFD